MISILLLEANEIRQVNIKNIMQGLNYDTVCATNIDEACQKLENLNIQLVLANSSCGGIELCELLRDLNNFIPLIILISKPSQRDKRLIFRAGADGYLPIPFDREELQMRVQTLLWRCKIIEKSRLRFGKCCLNSEKMTLETLDDEIELRRMEFLLLEKLLTYPGRIFTRPQLMDELWGYDSHSEPRTVDTHIRRLRQKLRHVEDINIQTIRGIGYRAVMPRALRKAEEQQNKDID